MKAKISGSLMFVGFLTIAGMVRADSNVSGNVNLSVGQKFLDDDRWKDDNGDFSEQFEFGLLFDIRPSAWPINIALDLLHSTKDEGDITASTSELAVGVRKYFLEKTNLQPFIGGGFANITGKETEDVRGTDVSVEESALGYWFMAGLQFRAAPHLNLGANVRYSHATAEVFDEDLEVGGVHYGLFVGYGF